MFEFWDPDRADPSDGVGDRHHIVPKFLLKRFASRKDQVWVQYRDQAKAGIRNAADLAIKDFYTFTNTDGAADGRFEKLLSRIEANAANTIRRLTSPILAARPFTEDERAAIAIFVAFQFVRGRRERRQIEIMADLVFRLDTLGPDNFTGKYHDAAAGKTIDLTEIVAIPDPTEHVKLACDTACKIFECLIDRPVAVAELTAGSLVICDEPVLVDRDGVDSQSHRPLNVPPGAELVHTRSSFGGIGVTNEVAIPIGRRWLLVLGPRGEQQPASPFLRLSRAESLTVADEANSATRGQAFEMVISHPDDRHLLKDALPDLEPLMHLCGLPEHFVKTVDDQSRNRQTMLRGRRL